MFELENEVALYYRLDLLIKYSNRFKNAFVQHSESLYEKYPHLTPGYTPQDIDIVKYGTDFMNKNIDIEITEEEKKMLQM